MHDPIFACSFYNPSSFMYSFLNLNDVPVLGKGYKALTFRFMSKTSPGKNCEKYSGYQSQKIKE